MKIEIGESLALSYLKHVKKCVFYQTNWKSSSQWKMFNEGIVENIFSKIKNIEDEIEDEIEEFNNIFRSDIDQTLKQAEIDVLGIDQNGKIYVMDIAYHEKGLNYKGKKKTIENLIKKLLRSYLMLLSYFPDKDYDIIFASPKVGPTVNGYMCEALKIDESKVNDEDIDDSELNTFEKLKRFSNKNVGFKNKVSFIYISNEAFRKEILDKTIKASESDSDSNELFMRSYKLLKLFNKISTITEETTDLDKEIPPTASLVLEFKPSDENAIQAITDKS